jgi:hypothetical protein
LKGYRFCWQLNRQMRLDFRITNQIEISRSGKKDGIILLYMNVRTQNSAITYTAISMMENFLPGIQAS